MNKLYKYLSLFLIGLIVSGSSFSPTITGLSQSQVQSLIDTSTGALTTATITSSTNKRYVTDANLTSIGNQNGTNSGDETQSSIKTKLGASSAGVDGYLTGSNWSTFNGKQSAITTGSSSQFLKGDLSLGTILTNLSSFSNDSNFITLTSFSATSPIFYNTSTGIISSQAATTSQNGYLTSTNWNTFNGKQSSITTGTTSQYFKGDLSLATFPVKLNDFGTAASATYSMGGFGLTNLETITSDSPASSSTPSIALTGQTTAGNDTGTAAIFNLNAKRDTPAVITTRPLFTLQNNGANNLTFTGKSLNIFGLGTAANSGSGASLALNGSNGTLASPTIPSGNYAALLFKGYNSSDLAYGVGAAIFANAVQSFSSPSDYESNLIFCLEDGGDGCLPALVLSDAGSGSALTIGTSRGSANGDLYALNANLNGSVILASHAANATAGAIYQDSTQKSIGTFVSGVKQFLVGTIFTQTADKTVSNTTTETSLMGTGVGTKTLPASFFQAGKQIRFKQLCYFNTAVASTPTIDIKIKLGSTVLLDTGVVTSIGINQVNSEFEINGVLTDRTTGTSGTISGQGNVSYANTTAVGTDNSFGLTQSGGAITVNTTGGTLAFDETMTWGTAASGNSITCTDGSLEVLN